MAEQILSPGVFTNEIDQSFLPATAGPIGAAVVGPTVKGPILIPTVVNSYREYLRQGGPLTVMRVGDADSVGTKATAIVPGTNNVRAITNLDTGSLFTLEALGDGPQFNNFVGSGSNIGTNCILTPRAHSITSNNHFDSGSFGGRSNNFRWEVSQRNLNKGTFTLLIRLLIFNQSVNFLINLSMLGLVIYH